VILNDELHPLQLLAAGSLPHGGAPTWQIATNDGQLVSNDCHESFPYRLAADVAAKGVVGLCLNE
jgi:hypothetical protein